MMKRPPKRYAGERPLDKDQMLRRASVVRTASDRLGGTGDTLAFLGAHHEALGDRPLDIATASAAGLAAAVEALAAAENAS